MCDSDVVNVPPRARKSVPSPRVEQECSHCALLQTSEKKVAVADRIQPAKQVAVAKKSGIIMKLIGCGQKEQKATCSLYSVIRHYHGERVAVS